MLGLEKPSSAAAAPIAADPTSAITASSSGSSKVELFQSLFRGRADVYAKRWKSRSGASGYAPACANEWRSGLCDKRRETPRIHWRPDSLSSTAAFGPPPPRVDPQRTDVAP
ncbi:MAG: TOTE conflict system archaeo-eukaryotic primase domain-containing protein [Coriobacteriia bacterium]